MNTDLILVCQEFYRLFTSRSCFHFFVHESYLLPLPDFVVSNGNVFHGEMLKRNILLYFYEKLVIKWLKTEQPTFPYVILVTPTISENFC